MTASWTTAKWADKLEWAARSGAPIMPLVQAIIDDARAGRVPEGELDALKAEAGRYRQLCLEKIEWLETNKAAAEAELAKAWEAGRDAAADHLKWCRDEECCNPQLVRALQPPGGKAK